MIKSSIIATLLCFVCVGCAGFSVQTDTQAAVIKTSSRVLGYSVAKEKPELVEPAIIFCGVIMGTEDDADLNELINFGVSYLSKEFIDDAMIAASVNDLAGMFTVDVSGSPGFDMVVVKIVVGAFQEGLLMQVE